MTPRRARAPAPGLRLDGDHARDDRRAARGERGGPHWASPDKLPARRLETIELAGELRIPFTSGILIGIGETRAERLEALDALREAPPPARPPPGGDRPELPREAGNADGRPPGAVARRPPLDDRGGAAPPAGRRLRPGAAEPRLRRLPAPPRRRHRRLGRRLAGHDRPREPGGAVAGARAARRRRRVRAGSSSRRGCPSTRASLAANGSRRRCCRRRCARSDSLGLAREDGWHPGERGAVPFTVARDVLPLDTSDELGEDGARAPLPCPRRGAAARLRGGRPAPPRGLRRRGQLRRHAEHPVHERLLLPLRLLRLLEGEARGQPARRAVPRAAGGDRPARARGLGAGGDRGLPAGRDPPGVHGRLLRRASSPRSAPSCPDLHIHAFSALEIWQGAATLGLPLEDYLERLRVLGLGSLPGTAAEILDDEVRARHLPGQGLDRAVARGARRRAPGRPALERDDHVRARRVAEALGAAPAPSAGAAAATGGFTELVPLPFVHMEAPIWLKGRGAVGADVRRDAAPARRRPARAASA